MENGDIPDENIQASGYFTTINGWSFFPWRGRLNSDGERGKLEFWAERGYNSTPWIQADLGYQIYVSGVITQGEGLLPDETPDWVTTLKVSTFKNSDNDEEVFVTDMDGEVMVSK